MIVCILFISYLQFRVKFFFFFWSVRVKLIRTRTKPTHQFCSGGSLTWLPAHTASYIQPRCKPNYCVRFKQRTTLTTKHLFFPFFFFNRSLQSRWSGNGCEWSYGCFEDKPASKAAERVCTAPSVFGTGRIRKTREKNSSLPEVYMMKRYPCIQFTVHVWFNRCYSPAS